MDRADVVRAWECCIDSDDPCAEECPMKDAEWKETGLAACRAFADDHVEVPLALVQRTVELLKAQEPRLITEADFANADECGYIAAWCEASNGLFAECITIRALQETDFRYWTSRPTDEQREAEPWND